MQTVIYVLLGNTLLSGAVYGCSIKLCSLFTRKRVIVLSAVSGLFNVALYFLPMSGAFKLPVKLLFFALCGMLAVRGDLRRSVFYLLICFFIYFSFEGVALFFGIDGLIKFLFALLLFVLLAVGAIFAAAERVKSGKLIVSCKVFSADGKKKAACLALKDTGDLVRFRDRGVIIASKKFLSPLQGEPIGRVEIHTPCGMKETEVFSLPIEIYSGGEKNIVNKAYIAPLDGLNDNDYALILPSEYCKEIGEC